MPAPLDVLLANAPCGLLTTDRDDRVSWVNSTFLEWTGFTEAQVVGRDFHLLLDSGSQVFYGTRYQAELWARGEVRELALTVVKDDGTDMPILMNARMTSPDGRAPIVQLAIFDSTGRIDYERQMLAAKRLAESSEMSVRILQDASTLFLAATSEAELGAAVSTSARDAFAASDVAVVAYEPDGTTFRISVGSHLRELLDAVRTSRPVGARALRADEVLLIPTLEDAFLRSDEVGRLFRAHRAEALSAVPIAAGDEVLGAFVFLFGRSRAFDDRAVELQRALARQAGLVLARLRLEAALERMAMHDQLTGLANRALLDECVSQSLAAAERAGSPISLIFIDLDGFKRINDELGHRSGDLVLKVVAARMNSAVREADIVGRFGGDEFLVICQNTDEHAVAAIAERLAEEISVSIEGIPIEMGVTASVGIAVYHPGESTLQTSESLVRQADAAMYNSKRAGAGLVTVVRV